MPVPSPSNSGLKLLWSRPWVRVGVLALPVQGILVETVIQLHLTPMVGRLLVSQMLHVELHSLHVSRDGL